MTSAPTSLQFNLRSWANLRRKNTGRDAPHNIKYWGLGNEMYGPWQVGHLSASDYVVKAKKWAHGLRLVDPSIKLVSCGEQVSEGYGGCGEKDKTEWWR